MAPHKFHQHDADPGADHEDDPGLLDLDAALALAVTPEDYLAECPEAIASAVEQAVHAS